MQHNSVVVQIVALFFFSVLQARAQVPEPLKKVEELYQRKASLAAHFEQREISKALGGSRVSQGKINWQAPNLLRWETETPEPNLLVSDGRTVWFYTPPFDETEKGQVVMRKTAQIKNKLLDALLAGRFSAAVKQGLRIESQPAPNQNTFQLLPRAGSMAGLKSAQVQINPELSQIIQVTLEYQDGNQSTIRLTEIALGNAIPAESFKFKIPPHTDILKE